MFKRTQLCSALMVAFGGSLAVASLPAAAQQQTLQRVEVTGSNIKRTDTETASPVQVLTREDIERTGKQTIQEVLRGITGDNSGSIPTSFTAGFASGSSAISLRGLGVNSTLVLVNGRRMTTYGLADDGQRSFVDLNSIPLEAVERVEVLKDGASAIYGADAVGGVVNVILRKSYVGKSIGGSYGQSNRNDGQTTRAFGSIGFGDLNADKYNVFVTVEGSKQRHILSTDRGFIGEDDLRSLGFFDTRVGAPRPWFGLRASIQTPFGVATDPNTNVRTNLSPCTTEIHPVSNECLFNSKIFTEVQPAVDRLNLFGRGTLQISPAMTAYGELGLFYTKTRPIGTVGAGSDGGVFDPRDPLNPVLVHGLPTLPAAHPDNPFGQDVALGIRPTDFGGRNDDTDNTVTRLVLGLQGQAHNWDYDFGVGYIESRLKDINTGFMRASVLQAALDNGTYRINRPGLVDPAVLAAISPPLERKPKSSVSLIDFKATRELMDLPGGALGVALGAEYRMEKNDTPPVPFTDVADIIGLGYSAFNAKRHVTAVFGELTAPVAKWAELSAALRSDQYSDFGNSTTPKLGVKLKPIDQLAIRGTYSEAFRAPGPAELGGTTLGFTSVGVLSFGNPNLQPEKAKSYSLGFIYEPIPGTSATLDFYEIKRRNEIVQADPAAILGNAPSTGTPLSKIPGNQANSFIYYDSQGDLSAVSGQYQNAASTKTNGVDIELRHKMNLGSAGKMTAQLFWTHVNKYERTLSDGTTFEYAGTHGPIVLSSGAGTPKDKATLAITYETGPWSVTGTVNYVGPLKLIDHKNQALFDNGDGTFSPDDGVGTQFTTDGSQNCGVFYPNGSAGECKLPSFTTFDLYAKWSPMKNLDLNFSIQNLFDRKAPFDPYLVFSYGINYNQTWHQSGAVGRFLTIGAKYSF